MPSSRALAAVRRSYERAHVLAALFAVAMALLPIAAAFVMHGITSRTASAAVLLAATIALFGWSGGGWGRGARVGLVAGLPSLAAPALVLAFTPGHCSRCGDPGAWLCVAACFGTTSYVGILLTRRARRDRARSSFAVAALAVAALTGLLGCGMTGLGGAVGIALGVSLGSIVGFTFANQATRPV